MSRFARKVVTVGALVGLMFGMSPAKAVELDHDKDLGIGLRRGCGGQAAKR